MTVVNHGIIYFRMNDGRTIDHRFDNYEMFIPDGSNSDTWYYIVKLRGVTIAKHFDSDVLKIETKEFNVG